MSSQESAVALEPSIAAWVSLMGAHAALTRAFNADLQAAHGLTVTDFEALRQLDAAENGEMRRVDLAQAIGLTPSGITRLLDGLEKAGLVCKRLCSSDARVSYAAITDRGRTALLRASEEHLSALTAMFGERFAPDEIAALAQLLARLPGGGDTPRCPTGAELPQA